MTRSQDRSLHNNEMTKSQDQRACSNEMAAGAEAVNMPDMSNISLDNKMKIEKNLGFQSDSRDKDSVSTVQSIQFLEPSECPINISDTFITIETKDGQSSEKIPFSRFLKEVVVDKESGNFTFNLGHLLGGAGGADDSLPMSNSHSLSSETQVSQHRGSSPDQSDNTSDRRQLSDCSLGQSDDTSDRRQPRGSSSGPSDRCKRQLSLSPSTFSSELSKQAETSIASKLFIRERAKSHVPKKESSLSSSKETTANTKKHNAQKAPRRSSRIPAKNKRFSDDYVNSLKLKKTTSPSTPVCSSSPVSSWNTQLMTLALAAETHKTNPQDDVRSEEQSNQFDIQAKQCLREPSTQGQPPANTKPHKARKSSLEKNVNSNASNQGDNQINRNSQSKCIKVIKSGDKNQKKEFSAGSTLNNNGSDASIILKPRQRTRQLEKAGDLNLDMGVSKGAQDRVSATPESPLVTNNSPSEEESHLLDLYPRGSKAQKMDLPVVRRTLMEALISAKDSVNNHLGMSALHQETAECSEAAHPAHIFYALMEPKLETQGHGLLLIRKAGKKRADFALAQVRGKPFNKKTDLSSKIHPQVRLFSCGECPSVFVCRRSWLQHRQSAHICSPKSLQGQNSKVCRDKYQCESCGQNFPHKFMLDIHVKSKQHCGLKNFPCTLCSRTFSSQKMKKQHLVSAHPLHSCGLCGKHFTNINLLCRHIGTKCRGAKFSRQADVKEVGLVDDVVLPTSNLVPKVAEKNSLPKGFQDVQASKTYAAEMNSCAGKEAELHTKPTSSSQPPSSEPQKLHCCDCSKVFVTSSGLWKHQMQAHQQCFPHGFKERLLEKLEKNQALLCSTENTLLQKSSAGNKSQIFVIMNPKIAVPKIELSVSVDGKQFTFEPKVDQKLEAEYTISNTSDIPLHKDDLKAEAENTSSIPSGMNQPSFKQITFDCNQCNKPFHSASSYKEHRTKIHGDCFEGVRLLGAFRCTLCSESYPCQFMLDRHLRKHVGKKLLPCTLCGLQFHKIQERREHWKRDHPGIGCPNCGKMYASIKYLQKHISLNCQDHFPPTQKFLEFQKKQHNDFEMDKDYKRVEKKLLRCHLCPKILSSVHGWRRHMSDAHEDAGFSKLSNTCIICGQLVYGYKALEKHILDKHAEDSGLPVDEENSLVEEALRKSETDIEDYKALGRNTYEITQDEFGNYQCPSCSKTHSELRAIKTHMRTHLDMELECSHCGKTFKNPALLKQHIQRHRKQAVYTCETCNKSFLTLLKLNKHCKVHHAKGNFVCELCGASFALSEYLQKHKKCHTDVRPHACTVCAKTFRTKAELRVHFLTHTRETPHICQYCGRGFSQRGNYRTHLAQHTGEKPYQCHRCPLSFALKCHLKRHLAIHDQQIQYRCLWCDKECTQRKHMQMHVQRVHKEDFIQHEEDMKLDTPAPIPESQARLYNRRPAKANKIRKQYRTKVERCDPMVPDHEVSSDAMARMVLELPATSKMKTESMEVASADDDMIHAVEGMEEQSLVSCAVPAVSEQDAASACTSSVANFEILVNGGSSGTSEDHQAYTKGEIPLEETTVADLLLQQNMQLVVGENDEISIIINNEGNLHQNALSERQEFEPTVVHPSLQEAIAALASHSLEVKEENGVEVSLGIGDLEKEDRGAGEHILNFVSVSEVSETDIK